MKEKIIEKCLSGRYLLTILSGVAFVWVVVHNLIPPAATVAIILSVYKDYFNKKKGDV